MDFNIRAISLAPSVPFDARTPVLRLLGKEVQFRSGMTIALTLPDDPGAFDRLPEPERVLTALDWWARVYEYPLGNDKIRHILAPAEGPDEELLVCRMELLQLARIKPGPRPPVQILSGAIMTYDECAKWLADISYQQALAHSHTRGTVLQRPRFLTPPSLRIAWVGPEKLDGESLPSRLRALGSVMGAEITHVGPQTFAHVRARLAGIKPIDAVALCTGTLTYITGDVAPNTLPPEALHYCSGTTLAEIQDELITIIEAARARAEEAKEHRAVDENAELIRIMLGGMISHSKIGPFNHCTRETVLKRVRARRLHVPAADALLDHHSEIHQDTKTSEMFFLYKEHHDGRQYFLNPKKVEQIKALIAVPGG